MVNSGPATTGISPTVANDMPSTKAPRTAQGEPSVLSSAGGVTHAVLGSSPARSYHSCPENMAQVKVGATPEPVITMPERVTLSPSALVIATAYFSRVFPSVGGLLM